MALTANLGQDFIFTSTMSTVAASGQTVTES